MAKKLDLTFVIPAKDEEDNIEPLYNQILKEVSALKKSYEIIFIDDGSTDKTFEKISNLRKKNKNIKAIKHRGNWGKSAALMSGFGLARGNTVFTMDADLQDNPADIPRFLNKLDKGYDLVTGWKKSRKDSPSVVILSKILNNFLIPRLTGIHIHDTNCGYKAYKNTVIQNIDLYGELYRFIPIIAAKKNFKIGEIWVRHRKRKHGKSKYNWTKNIRGFLDLLTVFFLTGYRNRPGHFFGTLGLISFALGFFVGLYIAYLRITTGSIQFRHPLLFLGMLLMIIGVQLVTSGLIAEMIVSFNQSNSSSKEKAEESLL